MKQPQSAERPSHRRGSDVESPSRAAEDRRDEKIEQAPQEPPVDETDGQSSGGPDSLEDIEEDSQPEDVER